MESSASFEGSSRTFSGSVKKETLFCSFGGYDWIANH